MCVRCWFESSHGNKDKEVSMSRTYRDAKGGHTSSKYGITHEPVSKFKRYCRRTARNKAKQALRRGEEPQPHYPVEKLYWD